MRKRLCRSPMLLPLLLLLAMLDVAQSQTAQSLSLQPSQNLPQLTQLLLQTLPRNMTLGRARAADVLVEWQRLIGNMSVGQFREFSDSLVNLRHDMFDHFNALFGVDDFNVVCHFYLLPNLIHGDNYEAVQALAKTWFEFVVQSLRGNSTHHFMYRYLQQYLQVGKSEVTYSNLLRHSGRPSESTLYEFTRRHLPDAPVPEDCRRTLLVQLTNPQQLLRNEPASITAVLQARLLNTVARGTACLQFNTTHKVIGFVDTIIFGHFEALRLPNSMWIDPRLDQALPGQLSSVTGLIRYGYPALLIVGTISNLVALFFSAVVLSESSVCLYFLALSLLDLLCLWCNLLPTILSLYADVFLHQISSATCRLMPFLETFFMTAAAWTVAALAIARLLSVLMPFNGALHSRRAHRSAIVLVLVTVAGLCSPLLVNRYRMVLLEADLFAQCWRWDWLFFGYRTEKLWLAAVFPALPLSVILLCNCVLLGLRDRHLRQAAATGGAGASSDRRQSFGSMTFVSSVFLVFTAPNTIVQLIEVARSEDIKHYDVIEELSNGTGTLFNYWAHVTHFVMLLHNAFNIFTYGMSAPYLRLAFRLRLARGLRCAGFMQAKPLYGSVVSMRTCASAQRADRTDTESAASTGAASIGAASIGAASTDAASTGAASADAASIGAASTGAASVGAAASTDSPPVP